MLTRRELLQTLAATRFLRLRPGLTSLPFTYIIDYRFVHVDNPDYIRQVAAAPPNLLHFGLELPFWGSFGPVRALAKQDGKDKVERTTPEQVRTVTAAIGRMVENLHRAGVDVVIPYVCNQTMFGDAVKRLGFWEFYDHWDEYKEFGLPPRPAEDPVEWLQKDPEGNPNFNYRLRHKAYLPLLRYAPCPNNPAWDLYLRFVAGNLAAAGYDGTFVDNNILHCYCKHCRKEFHRYLAWRYTAPEIRRNFGTSNVEEIDLNWQADKSWFARNQPDFRDYILAELPPDRLQEEFGVTDIRSVREWNQLGNGFLYGRGVRFVTWLQNKYTAAERKRRFGREDLLTMGLETPEARLRWVETQRFWAWSIAENLIRLQKAGLQHRADFFVLPNWGEIGTASGAFGRCVDAKNVTEWSRGCNCLMFEEDVPSGRTAPKTYHDRLLEYRYALANGMKPVILAYGKYNAALTEVAHAEAAAGGGGAFVQVSYEHPEIRTRYRRFFERNPELFVDLEPYAQVALTLSFKRLHAGDRGHMEQVLAWSERLGNGHFLFQVLDADRSDQPPLTSFAHVVDAAAAGGRPSPAPSPALAFTERTDIPGLRATAYSKRAGRDLRIVVHLVNYEATDSTETVPVRDLPLSIPLPGGKWSFGGLRLHRPGSRETALAATIDKDRLRCQVEEVGAYCVLAFTLRAGG